MVKREKREEEVFFSWEGVRVLKERGKGKKGRKRRKKEVVSRNGKSRVKRRKVLRS